MGKILAIIKREYLTRIRGKGFIIGTILSPLLMILMITVPVFLARGTTRNDFRLIILDQTSDAAFITRLDQLLNEGNNQSDRYTVNYEVVPIGDDLASRQPALNQQIKEGKINGYVVLPRGVLNNDSLDFHAKNVSDFGNRSRINSAINSAITERRLALAGIDAARVKELSRKIDLKIINEYGESDRGQTFILAYVMVMILYVTLLIYGLAVMRGVIEEKQSRIVEVLLSSVQPFQLMAGKLVGIGLVGLTQYLIWAVSAILISSVTSMQSASISSFKMPHIPASLLVFFVVYFILGYFFFATLYAMVGAMVSNEEDGQQLQMPVTMGVVLSIVLSSVVLRDPNGTTSTVLSLIPLFTPVLMFMRISLQTPPVWQIALSIVLMIGTILGAIWVAARIYRVGILMYGKRPTLPEIVKWLRYS
jgi:ABC-2 type transport system permease protein